MSFVLLIVSTTVAQEVYKDKHFTINTTKPKYQSYYYTAFDSINLEHGFYYEAINNCELELEVSKMLLISPEYGEDVNQPLDINVGWGMPYTLPVYTDVNDNGAATINIPIECPKGINGFQPDLSFVYNSQSGDGIMGTGWSIGGMSKISRVPYTYHYSDHTNAVTFTNTDNYSLDGNRLLKGTDGMYYPEVFDNSIISYSESSGFVVRKPNGYIYRYGTTDKSRYYINGINKPIEWHLEEIEDTYGNKINFYYYNDIPEGSFYPTRIVYGGKYEIKFEYHDNNRTNTQKKYFSTSSSVGFSKITKLLKEISFYYANDESWFQKYVLLYTHDGEFSNSKLTNIEKYGSNNIDDRAAANQVCNAEFIWENNERTLQKDVIPHTPYTGKIYNDNNMWCQSKLLPVKFNHISSTNHTDLIHLLENNNVYPYYYMKAYMNQSMYFNTSDNSENFNYVFNFNNDNNNINAENVNSFLASVCNIVLFEPIDTDGDGYNEILCINKINEINHVNIIRFNPTGNIFTIEENIIQEIRNSNIPYEFYIGDYDGNGCTDMFIINGNSAAVYFSIDGVFNERRTKTIQLYHDDKDREFIVGDFNGDGRDQILCLCKNAINSSITTLIKFDRTLQDPIILTNVVGDEFADYKFETNNYNKCAHLCSGDFNGDNKQDILVIMNRYDDHNWYFYLSQGNGKFSEKITAHLDQNNISDFYDNIVLSMADFNNDGFTDLDIMYKKNDTVYNSSVNHDYYIADIYYRCEYLIRVDDGNVKIIKKNLVDGDQELPIEKVRVNNTAIWRKNHLLSCVGNFRGTSQYERIYTKLNYAPNTNGGEIYTQLINVGMFDSIATTVISEVANGFGVKTKYDYVHHAGQGKWTDNLRTESSVSFAQTYIPQTQPYSSNLWVVKEMQRETNQRKYRTAKYYFTKPILHTRGKGFLGFANVSKIEETQQSNIKITTSKQFTLDPNYFIFYPENIKVYTMSGTLENPSFNNISETLFTFESKKLSAYPNMPAKAFYPHQNTVTNKNYYNSTCHKTTFSQIDEYGNPTLIFRQFGNSSDNLLYSERNSIAYVNKTSPKRIIGLVNNKINYHYNYNNNDLVIYNEHYEYDDNGFMILSNQKGITKTYARDNFGNITSMTESSNGSVRTNTMTYSQDGILLLQNKNTLNHTTSYSYFANKALLKNITDPNGLVTTYNYDILDNIKSIEYPDGTKEEFVRRWVHTNSANTVSDHPDIPDGIESVYYTWSKKNGQNEVTTFYDQHERKVRTVVMDMNDNKYYTDYIYYDISGLLWKESLPYCKSQGETPQYIEYVYDIYDRILTITKPDGSNLSNKYSDNTLITTNFDGQQKTTTYHPLGKPYSIRDNENTTINYEYYGDGNIKSTIVNDNEKTRVTYTYDANGFPTSINDPSLGLRTYSYNAFGELLSETNPDSTTTNYIYDPIGRMVRRIDDDGTTLWIYDNQIKGFLSHLQYTPTDDNAPNVVENYSYDRLGRLRNHTQSLEGKPNLSLLYDYNEWGLQNSITYPTGYKVAYKYDYNGFVTSVENALTEDVVWKAESMDKFGNLTNFTLGDNISVSNSYNNITGLVENQSAEHTGQYVITKIQDLDYSWDIHGNLTNRQSLGLNEEFQYDNFNRLTKVITNGKTYSIIYSNLGNILGKSGIGNMYYNNNNPYALAKVIDISDLSLFNEEQNITYNSFNKVSSIEQGVRKMDVYYDGGRQRVYQHTSYEGLSNTKTKRYFTNLYEEESLGGIVKKYHYLTSPSGLFAIFVTDNIDTTMSYILKDHLGSMYATVTNGSVDYYSFDAWGRERNPNTFLYDNVPSHSFSRGFCMHEHYRDFGLINMNGRMYDPLVGRMLSPDIEIQNPEYSQSYNRYSYCFNNPLRFTDPSGYVVTIPPEFEDFYMPQYFSDFNVYKKELEKMGANNVAFNTDIVNGTKTTTIKWEMYSQEYQMSVVDHKLKDYIQYCENSCVADAFAAQEARLNGNNGLTPEIIMSWKENSCEEGLTTSDIIPRFLEKSTVYDKNYKVYMEMILNKNPISYFEKRAFTEMTRNSGVFFMFGNDNINGHVVNASIATQFFLDNQSKGYEIIIWDSGLNKDKVVEGYKSMSFYDLNKLYGKFGTFFKR